MVKLFSFPKRMIARLVKSSIQRRGGVLIFYGDPERKKVMNLINKIRRETDLLLYNDEAYQLFMGVSRVSKTEGDIAEVGVYKGGSAKLICEAKGNKRIHLFDTFEGIPETDEIDRIHFHQGQFASSIENVKKLLNEYKNVFFYKGIFPQTSDPIKNTLFSFVNLDVDTYEGTQSCLYFFYPRMTKGGIIIVHDYFSAIGVRNAVDEFFKDKPEPVIEMSGSQCLIVKL